MRPSARRTRLREALIWCRAYRTSTSALVYSAQKLIHGEKEVKHDQLERDMNKFIEVQVQARLGRTAYSGALVRDGRFRLGACEHVSSPTSMSTSKTAHGRVLPLPILFHNSEFFTIMSKRYERAVAEPFIASNGRDVVTVQEKAVMVRGQGAPNDVYSYRMLELLTTFSQLSLQSSRPP